MKPSSVKIFSLWRWIRLNLGLGAKRLRSVKHIATTSDSQNLLVFVDQSAFDIEIKAKLIWICVSLHKSPKIKRIFVSVYNLFKLRGLKKSAETFSEKTYSLSLRFPVFGAFYHLIQENNLNHARKQDLIFFPKAMTCILAILYYHGFSRSNVIVSSRERLVVLSWNMAFGKERCASFLWMRWKFYGQLRSIWLKVQSG